MAWTIPPSSEARMSEGGDRRVNQFLKLILIFVRSSLYGERDRVNDVTFFPRNCPYKFRFEMYKGFSDMSRFCISTLPLKAAVCSTSSYLKLVKDFDVVIA